MRGKVVRKGNFHRGMRTDTVTRSCDVRRNRLDKRRIVSGETVVRGIITCKKEEDDLLQKGGFHEGGERE